MNDFRLGWTRLIIIHKSESFVGIQQLSCEIHKYHIIEKNVNTIFMRSTQGVTTGILLYTAMEDILSEYRNTVSLKPSPALCCYYTSPSILLFTQDSKDFYVIFAKCGKL